MRLLFLLILSVVGSSCSRPDSNDSRNESTSEAPEGTEPEPKCLPREEVDQALATSGSQFLNSGGAAGRFLPRFVLDNLWRTWATQRPEDVPLSIRERYGFAKALSNNDGLPMGMYGDGTWVNVDCLLCHAGEVAGETYVGAANNQVNLELFLEDIQLFAQSFGQSISGAPSIRTGAKGVNDIVGMTMQLALQSHPSPTPVNTEVGYQDAPAWWTFGDKSRVYTDGSAPQSAHRYMMATQMAFGTSESTLATLEPQYIALRQHLLTLQAPQWPFQVPPSESVARGQTLYRQRCTACHRHDACEKAESVVVPLDTVGTDSERSTRYQTNEVAVVNQSFFAQDESHAPTNGYIAPSLRGVWASAPYFHNGSVPTLEAVLNSALRPKYFKILGTQRENYDESAVGLKVEVFDVPLDKPTREERATVYDTTKPGLGNQGHTFGDSFTAEERADLLNFLKTL